MLLQRFFLPSYFTVSTQCLPVSLYREFHNNNKPPNPLQAEASPSPSKLKYISLSMIMTTNVYPTQASTSTLGKPSEPSEAKSFKPF